MENDQVVKALLEFLVKNAPGFFSTLGFLAALVMVVLLRRPAAKLWRKFVGAADESEGKRRDDGIILQFLAAYKQSVEMGAQIVAEVHGLADAIRQQTAAQNDGFRDLHRKLDHAMKPGHGRG